MESTIFGLGGYVRLVEAMRGFEVRFSEELDGMRLTAFK